MKAVLCNQAARGMLPCTRSRPTFAGLAGPQGSRPRAGSLVRNVQQAGQEDPEVVDCGNILEYCSLDEDGNLKVLTLGEKEQLFLDALTSFYYDGKPAMSDSDFDVLKEELLWSGSKVAILSSNEKKFLEAQMAYNAGKPVLSDTEFDALRAALRQENSIVTAQGPRCSIRSKKMYSDASVDYLKMVGLSLPAALLVLLGMFSIDDLTGFEITKLLELPEPYGVVVVWGAVLPVIYVLSNAITGLVFRDALILKASCPNCGTENFTYFGDIFTVAGNREKSTVECGNCKSSLQFDANSRQVEVVSQEDK